MPAATPPTGKPGQILTGKGWVDPATVPLPPWEPCPDCEGAGVTPCGRFTSENKAPDYPCGTCGATGLKRVRDPGGNGVIYLPPGGLGPTGHHQRLAETLIDELGSHPLKLEWAAQFLADFEAFVRSPPA